MMTRVDDESYPSTNQPTTNLKTRYVEHNITDNGDGSYRVEIETALAADYKVSFTVRGAPTLRGPWTVGVEAGAVTQRSTARYLTQATAGVDNSFIIEPRDQYDNVIKVDKQLGGTCRPTATKSCPVVVNVYDEDLNLLPITVSKPWFEYTNQTFYGHFYPPVNSSNFVYIRVFVTDLNIATEPIPIIGSVDPPGQYVEVVPGPATVKAVQVDIRLTLG